MSRLISHKWRITLAGAFWVTVYLALILTPLLVLVPARAPMGGGFWWDVAIGLGFAGLVMMSVQFVLTARFRKATAPFGVDVIYYFHRFLAYVGLVVVLAHPAILLIQQPALRASLDPRTAPWQITAGVASVVLLLVLVGASAFRKRLRIPYEAWRVTHLVLAVGAVGLAFAHMLGIGYSTSPALVKGLWALIGASLVAVVVWVRLVRPWRLLRAPYRVSEVRPERGDAWTLTLEPVRHAGLVFKPGQFAWLSLTRSPFAMREHPFSIASSPREDGTLRFTIKELGDFTRTLGQTRVGQTAYVDGPYGAFSIDRHPDASGYVFIAGGIGVSPIVSMLMALADRGDRRKHVAIVAHSGWDRVPLRDELAALTARLDLELIHVLEEPPEGWEGERGYITAEMLARRLPAERAGFEVFVCGPVAMSDAVERHLHRLGVPLTSVHTELFDMV
jgi:predicted ferric reductase